MKNLKEALRSKMRRFLRVPNDSYAENCFYRSGWGKAEQGFFNRKSKAYLFRAIGTFFSTHDVPGDYFEFGCFGGYTMRMAWDHFRVLRGDTHYFAFDSFQGFPDVDGVDVGHWKKGDLSMSESQFRHICSSHGIPAEKLTTIQGFFENSLKSEETANTLKSRKAAVVYIDVDTYSPAKEVLEFIEPYLQRGTIIVFDDWNCFFCDDSLGERRAWMEFTQDHPKLTFSPFVSTHVGQSFVCLGPNSKELTTTRQAEARAPGALV
jgi:O-methyltransferase